MENFLSSRVPKTLLSIHITRRMLSHFDASKQSKKYVNKKKFTGPAEHRGREGDLAIWQPNLNTDHNTL